MCYGDLLSVIFGVSIVIVLECHTLHLYKMANLIDKRSVCSDCSTPVRSSVSLLLFRPPYSLRHNNGEIRPVNDPPLASNCSIEQKSCTSHFIIYLFFINRSIVDLQCLC